MDHEVNQLSMGNDPIGKSVLTWKWIPSEGSVSSVDSLASMEARFSSTDSQCSTTKKLSNKFLRSESPLWLEEESGVELRRLESCVSGRRLDSQGEINKKHVHTVHDTEGNKSLSYEELQSSRVKFMCSYGGKIMPRPLDRKLRYVSGETRIISVNRDIRYSELMSKLRELYLQDLRIKYQLPGEDLDALVSVSSDEDLENMMEEYDRLSSSDSNLRLRVFLFSVYENEQASYIHSIGDSRAAEDLYVDAVNGLLVSCSEKTMDVVAVNDAYSPWESGESAVFSPSHSLRAHDQGLVVRRMIPSQTVSNPSSAPQSAPSSPSFLTRPLTLNKAVLDLPQYSVYDPRTKLKTYVCENALMRTTNQEDVFSSSASSSNKDLYFQVSESRKSPNSVGSLHHEIRPVHSQVAQHRVCEEAMPNVVSPRKLCDTQELQLVYKPLMESFADIDPGQGYADSQSELQRHLCHREFPPSVPPHGNQCYLDGTASPRVHHPCGNQSHFEEKLKFPQVQANVVAGYSQGADWSARQEASAGVCSYAEVGNLWHQQGHVKHSPELFVSQIVPPLMQHDGVQGQNAQGRPEYTPQNGFQERYCQTSELCPFYHASVHKLKTYVGQQLHQDDLCRCQCKLCNPSQHCFSDENPHKFAPSCTCEVGSAPSSPRPGYHDISDQQARLKLLGQRKHNGALMSDEPVCFRSHASINRQGVTPFQMSASPPLYAETEKLKECEVCLHHFRHGTEFGMEKQNPNFLPLPCEEAFVCEGCYPGLQCNTSGCHRVHCLQPNTNPYHQDKVFSDHVGKHFPTCEPHIDLSGKRREEWPFELKVETKKDDFRMVDRVYWNPNSEQGSSFSGGVENEQTGRNMRAANLGTFVDQVPRTNHLHETSAVPSQFMAYGLNFPAAPSAFADNPSIFNGKENHDLLPKTVEMDSWSGALRSKHKEHLHEPEDIHPFGIQSGRGMLSASSNVFSQMSSKGSLRLDSAHCQHQEDLRQVYSKPHEGALGSVAGTKFGSTYVVCVDGGNGTCSPDELNSSIFQHEGALLKDVDSVKSLASSAISSEQPLPRGCCDNEPTEIPYPKDNSAVSAKTATSFLATGKRPVNSTSTGEACSLSKVLGSSTETLTEVVASPELHAVGDSIKCEKFTLVSPPVSEKMATGMQPFANKDLAEDCAFSLPGSDSSQEKCDVTEEATFQAGYLLKAELPKEKVLSQNQSTLLEVPTFSIQAWEEALNSVVSPISQERSEEPCENIVAVSEICVENPLPTEEELFEAFKSEPSEKTNCDTCCSSDESASAAATKAIQGGLQTIKNSDLEEIRELGSGNFGTVYHGKWRGSDVAIKRIKASCFTGRSSEQERLLADFWKEANTLSQLHHPNVVAFYGVVPDGPGGTLATVTEFMVNGSLKQVLQKKDRTIDRRKRVLIAMDAAFGMEYLHGKNIVHFDLKCENLLVNMRDPHRPICKVGDLGLSKVKQQTMVSGGIRGTLPWMAPELLSGNSSMVTEKIDVFSFAIVMWELLTGEEPYADMHYGAIIGGIVNNTLRPSIPSWCDPAWKSLMERCWAADSAARPSFADIVNELRTMTESLQPKPQKPAQTLRL